MDGRIVRARGVKFDAAAQIRIKPMSETAAAARMSPAARPTPVGDHGARRTENGGKHRRHIQRFGGNPAVDVPRLFLRDRKRKLALHCGAAGLAFKCGEIQRTARHFEITLERNRKRRRSGAAKRSQIGGR